MNRWFREFEPHPFCEAISTGAAILGAGALTAGASLAAANSGGGSVTTTSGPSPYQQSASGKIIDAVDAAADPRAGMPPEFIANPAAQQFIYEPGAAAPNPRVAQILAANYPPGALVQSTASGYATDVPWEEEVAYLQSQGSPNQARIDQILAANYPPGTLVQSTASGYATDVPWEQELQDLGVVQTPNPAYDPNAPAQIPNPEFNPYPESSPFVAPLSPQTEALQQQLIDTASTVSPTTQAAEQALLSRISNPNAGVLPQPPVQPNPAIAPALQAAQSTPPQVAAATPLLTEQATPGALQTDTSFLQPFAQGNVQTDVSALTPALTATTDTSALDPILSGEKLIDTSALDEWLASGGAQTDLSYLEPWIAGENTNPANELFLRMFEGELGGNAGMAPLLDLLSERAFGQAKEASLQAGDSGASPQELANMMKLNTQYAAPFVFDQYQKDQQLRAQGAQLYGASSAQDLANQLAAAVEGTSVRARDVLTELAARGAITDAKIRDVENYLSAAGIDIGAKGSDLVRQLQAAQGITSVRSQDTLNRLAAAGEIAGFSGADLLRNLQAGGALGDLGLGVGGLQNQALGVAGQAAANDTLANTQRFGISQDAATRGSLQQLTAMLSAPEFQQTQIGNLLTALNASTLQQQQQQNVINAPLQFAQGQAQALSPILGLPSGGSATTVAPTFGPTTGQIFGNALQSGGNALLLSQLFGGGGGNNTWVNPDSLEAGGTGIF